MGISRKTSRNESDAFVKAFEAAYGMRPSFFAAVLATLDSTTVIGRYGVDRTGA